MDETSMAFETPMARAKATGGTALLDRISVRDHVREVEIGAFRSERGVTQRIRFNVVLEIASHSAAADDDVDKVVSYDAITQAITDILAAQRINLLETLAERLAEQILQDPRAFRVFIRIEKLDRIPGALGVEIVRSRLPDGATSIAPVTEPDQPKQATQAPRVVFLSPEALAAPTLPDWLDIIVDDGPAVICVPPQPGFASALNGEPGLRQMLLSIEQSCWDLAARDPRILVGDTRTEIDFALRAGQTVVWAPQRLLTAAVPRPDISSGPELALWIGKTLGARAVHVIGGKALDGAQHHAPGTPKVFAE